MIIRKGMATGTAGHQVYVNTKYGQVVRCRPGKPIRATPARQRARAAMGVVAGAWRGCTAGQREAWAAGASKVFTEAADGTLVPLAAYAYFSKINLPLAAAGLPLLMDPPPRARFKPNPVAQLDITNCKGVIALRLRVPKPLAGYIFVLGSPPCSPGKTVRSNYSILGRLRDPKGGWSDITEDYAKKFGAPPPGARVFIRTRQLINGWEDAFKDTCADVPQA